jgi:hypothetical protein
VVARLCLVAVINHEFRATTVDVKCLVRGAHVEAVTLGSKSRYKTTCSDSRDKTKSKRLGWLAGGMPRLAAGV